VAETKQEETFKVVDRRLFTQDGQLRKDVLEQERREEEVAQKASTKIATPTTAPSKAQGQSVASTPGTATGLPAANEDAAGSVEPSRGFQLLVDFLTRNAAAMLGGVADPRTGQAYLDLEGARELIDMLDALREKTRGNLAQADEDLLIEVIGSLKLTYMEMSKAAAEAMNKKAKGKG
jgi:Domain of unknown function (DUF1844)